MTEKKTTSEDLGVVWDNHPMEGDNAVGNGFDVNTGEYSTVNKEVENNG